MMAVAPSSEDDEVIPPNGNAEAVAELLAGGGGVRWLTSFVESTLAGGPSEPRVDSTVSPGRDEWNLEVTADGVSLAQIDVRALTTGNPADLDSRLDALTAKAVRRWGLVTQQGIFGQIRPWLACVMIGEGEASGEVARAADELDALTRQRILDVACVVQVDSRGTITHPSSAMSLDAFAAGLIGRQTYWSAMTLA